jgi:hypothetical protein
MVKLKVVCVVLFLVVLSQPLLALGDQRVLEDRFKERVNEVVLQVKEMESPVSKRGALNLLLTRLIGALERVESMPLLSDRDRTQVAGLRGRFQDTYDELNGLNGFERVPDGELDGFADYILQDLEQARANTVTMSVWILVAVACVVVLIIA